MRVAIKILSQSDQYNLLFRVAKPGLIGDSMGMCIVAFAWKAHPRWKFIAIGNRDELHARPAEPLARWPGSDQIIAGRDVQAGGTWLGVSEQGRFAVVTNLSGFGAPDSHRASRGDLLKDFLANDGSYANPNYHMFSEFNPFNLITVVGNEALAHSNRPAAESRPLAPGIFGLSNGPLDRPWLKSDHLNVSLRKWLANHSGNIDSLFSFLSDETDFKPSGSPDIEAQSALEPEHSPVFIRNEIYGTRCSTVVAVDEDGQGLIMERRFASTGAATGETSLSFSWPEG